MFEWNQAISKTYMEMQRNTNSQDTVEEQESKRTCSRYYKVTVNKITWYCCKEIQIEQ